MIKRFVILQDEQMVMRELTRPRLAPQSSAAPAPSAAYATAGQEHTPPGYQSQPYAPAPPAATGAPAADVDEVDVDDAPPPPGQEGRRLSEVAREAATAAERAVISDTLRQVQWNRRKAAQLLGVSYKTLLNKIKETGLERP
jgi:DNA-binding NtrC family response regulator